MTHAIQKQQHPKDSKTGLTLPLSDCLDSQTLGKHRALVGFELDVLAVKYGVFGWERDRDNGSPVRDRMIQDWMDALHDFPLDEVKQACRSWVDASPRRMPNEGDIKKLILRARHDAVLAHKAQQPKKPEPVRERVSPERAAQIAAAAGFNWGGPKRFPKVGEGAE